MRSILFFLCLNAVSFGIYAQLNCKKSSSELENTSTCFHKNGAKSTVESWDKQGREGKITGFDKEGKELFSYYLRSFAGHASAHLSYYANGQVSKVEYSSAPDGGIQFYQESHSFDENGTQSGFWKMDYPNDLRSPVIREHVLMDTVKPVVKKAEPEVFVPYETLYKITNTTRKKIILEVRGQKNKWVELKDREIIILPGRELSLDTVVLSKRFLEAGEGYSLSLSAKNKKRGQLSLVPAQPVQSGDRKEYSWIILRNGKP